MVLKYITVYEQNVVIHSNGIRRIQPVFIRPIDKTLFASRNTVFTNCTKIKITCDDQKSDIQYVCSCGHSRRQSKAKPKKSSITRSLSEIMRTEEGIPDEITDPKDSVWKTKFEIKDNKPEVPVVKKCDEAVVKEADEPKVENLEKPLFIPSKKSTLNDCFTSDYRYFDPNMDFSDLKFIFVANKEDITEPETQYSKETEFTVVKETPIKNFYNTNPCDYNQTIDGLESQQTVTKSSDSLETMDSTDGNQRNGNNFSESDSFLPSSAKRKTTSTDSDVHNKRFHSSQCSVSIADQTELQTLIDNTINKCFESILNDSQSTQESAQVGSDGNKDNIYNKNFEDVFGSHLDESIDRVATGGKDGPNYTQKDNDFDSNLCRTQECAQVNGSDLNDSKESEKVLVNNLDQSLNNLLHHKSCSSVKSETIDTNSCDSKTTKTVDIIDITCDEDMDITDNSMNSNEIVKQNNDNSINGSSGTSAPPPPQSLREYMSRAFSLCNNESNWKYTEVRLKSILKRAKRKGNLLTKDWSTEPLPKLPYCPIPPSLTKPLKNSFRKNNLIESNDSSSGSTDDEDIKIVQIVSLKSEKSVETIDITDDEDMEDSGSVLKNKVIIKKNDKHCKNNSLSIDTGDTPTPQCLTDYMNRAFSTCNSDSDRDWIGVRLKSILKRAKRKGIMFTKDWSTEPLPQLPPHSSPVFNSLKNSSPENNSNELSDTSSTDMEDIPIERDSFVRLGSDLTGVILSYLSLKDKLRFECVCKLWKAKILERQKYLIIRLKRHLPNNYVIKNMITFNNISDFNSNAMKLIKKFKSLRVLELEGDETGRRGYCRHTITEVVTLVNRTQNPEFLEKVMFSGNIGAEVLNRFGHIFGKRLKSLDINSGNFLKTVKQRKNIEFLSQNLRTIALYYNIRALNKIHLKRLEEIIDLNIDDFEGLKAIADKYSKQIKKINFFPNIYPNKNQRIPDMLYLLSRFEALESLDFYFSRFPVNEEFAPIERNCRKLKELHLYSNSSYFNLNRLTSFKDLRVLGLFFDSLYEEMDFNVLRTLNLTEVWLYCNVDLDELLVFGRMENLTRLHIKSQLIKEQHICELVLKSFKLNTIYLSDSLITTSTVGAFIVKAKGNPGVQFNLISDHFETHTYELSVAKRYTYENWPKNLLVLKKVYPATYTGSVSTDSI